MIKIEENNILTDEQNQTWTAKTIEEALKIVEEMKKDEDKNIFCDYIIWEDYRFSGYCPDRIILSEFSLKLQELGKLEYEISRMCKHSKKTNKKLAILFKSIAEKYESRACIH